MVSLWNPGWLRTHNFPATASMGGDYRITPLNQTSIFLQNFCTVGKGWGSWSISLQGSKDLICGGAAPTSPLQLPLKYKAKLDPSCENMFWHSLWLIGGELKPSYELWPSVLQDTVFLCKSRPALAPSTGKWRYRTKGQRKSKGLSRQRRNKGKQQSTAIIPY